MKIKLINKTAQLFIFLLAFIASNFAQGQNVNVKDLDFFVNQALQNNPEYLSAKAKMRAAQLQIQQAGALPDPNLGISVMNLPVNSFEFNQEPMTGKKLSLMQMFPFPGKLGIKEDMAEFQAQVVEQQVEELKNQLIKQVKLSYYSIFFTDKSIEIIEKNKTLVQQFVQVAEAKYSVGKGLQQDVLKAQVELLKLTDKLISLHQKRKNFVYQLNKLTNRDIASPINQIAEIGQMTFDLTIEEVTELGLNHRPLLKGWQHIIEKSRRSNKLAKYGYLPDFNVGIAYTQRENLSSGMKMYDFFSAEVKVSLPIYFYKKQSKKVEQTQQQIYSLENKRSDVRNEVLFQIEDKFSEIIMNSNLIALYKKGIIPQASQSLNSAMSGYQVDKIDFITLLNNQMTLFNYELEYYNVLTNHAKSLAQLDAAVGKELTKIDDQKAKEQTK
jgi:outer membrane protein, heavy metal efflux system